MAGFLYVLLTSLHELETLDLIAGVLVALVTPVAWALTAVKWVLETDYLRATIEFSERGVTWKFPSNGERHFVWEEIVSFSSNLNRAKLADGRTTPVFLTPTMLCMTNEEVRLVKKWSGGRV
jgi:hypothetical protein